MKILNCLISTLVLCSFIALCGCANTANGFHQDWKNNTQKIADKTGN